MILQRDVIIALSVDLAENDNPPTTTRGNFAAVIASLARISEAFASRINRRSCAKREQKEIILDNDEICD